MQKMPAAYWPAKLAIFFDIYNFAQSVEVDLGDARAFLLNYLARIGVFFVTLQIENNSSRNGTETLHT